MRLNNNKLKAGRGVFARTKAGTTAGRVAAGTAGMLGILSLSLSL